MPCDSQKTVQQYDKSARGNSVTFCRVCTIFDYSAAAKNNRPQLAYNYEINIEPID